MLNISLAEILSLETSAWLSLTRATFLDQLCKEMSLYRWEE